MQAVTFGDRRKRLLTLGRLSDFVNVLHEVLKQENEGRFEECLVFEILYQIVFYTIQLFIKYLFIYLINLACHLLYTMTCVWTGSRDQV